MFTGFCNTCNKPQESNEYRFCDYACQKAYIIIVESRVKQMNHEFSASGLNPVECAQCKRDYLSHTLAARCECCSIIGRCNLVDDILMCNDCERKHIESSREVTEEKLKTASEIIRESRAIDSQIEWSGDLFNAATVPFIELKKAFLSDESIPESERRFEYHKAVAERIAEFSKKLWELDEERKTLVLNKLAAERALRDEGNDIRKEIRARLQEIDNNYSPPAKVKKLPKAVIKKDKKSVYDMMVENTMTYFNCTREAAIEKLKNVPTKE